MMWVALLLCASSLSAQHVLERGGHVVYIDSAGRNVDVGVGFSPVLMHDGKVAFLRGRRLMYGDDFDCTRRETKNWVSVFDPASHSERVLFDRTLRFDSAMDICVFSQMQLSPDDSILYLVNNQWSATSGSLAIFRLHDNRVTYVGGVDEVYVIESGPHTGDLIYQQRLMDETPNNEHPYYPWIHGRPNGAKVKILAEEPFLIGDAPDAPKLKAYLQRIGGRIIVNGRPFP